MKAQEQRKALILLMGLWEGGACVGQTRLGTLSPMAAPRAIWRPCPLPVPNLTLSVGCFSSIPQQLQQQSPSPAQPSRHRGRGAV